MFHIRYKEQHCNYNKWVWSHSGNVTICLELDQMSIRH